MFTRLIPIRYWQEFVDMDKIFKITKDISYIDADTGHPKSKMITRRTRSSAKDDGTITLEKQLFHSTVDRGLHCHI